MKIIGSGGAGGASPSPLKYKGYGEFTKSLLYTFIHVLYARAVLGLILTTIESSLPAGISVGLYKTVKVVSALPINSTLNIFKTFSASVALFFITIVLVVESKPT
ncbi:hypothetical protein SDC9_95418 [bioreactor metagenome]|uniref:Uncharacterized protein n=1 Tax=bioreactor metagenome TaxID=1076179 RepID=A0A645A6H3_9ZZZZ